MAGPNINLKNETQMDHIKPVLSNKIINLNTYNQLKLHGLRGTSITYIAILEILNTHGRIPKSKVRKLLGKDNKLVLKALQALEKQGHVTKNKNNDLGALTTKDTEYELSLKFKTAIGITNDSKVKIIDMDFYNALMKIKANTVHLGALATLAVIYDHNKSCTRQIAEIEGTDVVPIAKICNSLRSKGIIEISGSVKYGIEKSRLFRGWELSGELKNALSPSNNPTDELKPIKQTFTIIRTDMPDQQMSKFSIIG